MEILGLNGGGDIRTEAWERVLTIEDADGLASGEEKPTTAKAHHAVPDETDDGCGQFEASEAFPERKAVESGHFVEFARHRTKGLVEGERHVPGLAGEDGEDGRSFETEEAAFEECDEGGNGDGEKAEHRDGLEDIEQRDEDAFGAFTASGGIAVNECEEGRGDEREEHAQGGTRRVVGEIARVQTDGRNDVGWFEFDKRFGADVGDDV